MTNGKKVPRKPNDNKPVGKGPTAPAPKIDTTGLVELAGALTEYYGGGAGKGYKVQKRKGADGSMELVIEPVSGDKRTFTITYGGQPDAQGFVSGTLKIDDKNAVPVRFHPKLGKNFLNEADAKKFAEFLTTSSGNDTKKPNGGGNGGGGGGGGNEPNAPTFQFFNPFQQPELANPNPATGATPNTPTERTPGFWDKLSDSLVNSLPFLITMLLMNSNRSED
jgi:acetylornithine deacetylase/succinyl-diaminopimelate desuccinylase-like protein